MNGQRISATFTLGALAILWSLTMFNGFQPAMIGLALLLTLEIALFAPLERRASPTLARRGAIGGSLEVRKAWWS